MRKRTSARAPSEDSDQPAHLHSLIRIFTTDRRARVWRRREQDSFQDNVAETEMFGGGYIMVWGCFNHNHKLDLVVVRQTLKGQRYIDDILQPIVYLHFRSHHAAHPIFQDDNARPHRARVVTESFAQEGIEKLQWPSRSPIEHCWDVLDVTS